MEHTKGELIAMQKDLGLGHKGDILLTTQERVDNNQEAIAKDIIDIEHTKELVRRWNEYPDLKQQRDDLIVLIWELSPKHQHDHDYFHDNCTLCGMEKLRYEKIEAAIKKAQ